jgi:hypothetical protein
MVPLQLDVNASAPAAPTATHGDDHAHESHLNV